MTEYGLQIYSVKDSALHDMDGTLAKVAEMGYTYAEFSSFYGCTPEDIKGMLEKYNLKISGMHASWQDLKPSKIYETIAKHKIVGNPYYIIPGADLSTLEKIEEFCAVMNYAQPILAAENIRLGYHNHSHEFVVMPWGSTIHAELERRTNIDFELDTFWVFHAGADPIAVLERLKDRIRVIHLKDGLEDGAGRSLGLGVAPVKAVREKAIEMGLTMVVESEGRQPTGIEEVTRCIEYLKTLE